MMFQRNSFRLNTTVTSDDLSSCAERRHLLDSTNALASPLLQHPPTKSKPHQLIPSSSSLRRIVIAIATLRLTSTSTVTTSAGSLTTLLKSLLVGCYYFIAFTSLLMLILYINNFALQNNRFSAQDKLELKGANFDMSSLVTDNVIHNSDLQQDFTLHLRFKRSLHVIASTLNPLNELETTKNARQSKTSTRRVKVTSLRSNNSSDLSRRSDSDSKRVSSRNKPKSIRNATHYQTATRLPELTYRQATSFSVNNRGTMSSSTSDIKPKLSRQATSNEGQWIPIVKPPAVQAKPKLSNQLQPAPTTVTLLVETSNHRNSNRARHRQLQSHHHGPHNQMNPYANRHWRRPRLNLDHGAGLSSRPSKMYKRVLLCDKTLVSLDYIRNPSLELEPRPFNIHHLDNNEFDDNVINLDSTLNYIFAERQSNATSAPEVPMTYSESRQDAHIERRSLLADDDPLVKCDMWDLEKGLKNRKPPKEILQMAVKADFDTVRDAINRCRHLSESTLPADDEYRDGIEIMSTEDLVSLFSMKRGLIPGTKWCGLGDQANSYNDLGSKHRIDICCRAHDHCPIRLKPFRNDYGVLNIALYTKSHCDCDADFYRCLREAHSRTADILGNLYFNVMKLQCIREERMKICREMKPIALGFERCVRYEESPVKTVFKFTTPPVAY